MAQKPKSGKRRPSEDERVDEGIAESFPASDPPSYSGAVSGTPRRRKSPPKKKEQEGSGA